MTPRISASLLSQLSAFVADQLGLHFPRERWSDLERGLQSAAREFGAEAAEPCARWLLSARLTESQLQTLASNLTVGETYFFREKSSLEALGAHILPALLGTQRSTQERPRIWSAGCCTGEEPYSIAILLDRLFPQSAQVRPTILATDINPVFLRKAATGVFSEWSFRDPPPWLKENYFTPVAGRRYEILPRIRQRVTFAYLNLAQDTYPSLATDTNAMDLILCRNVLMYFAPEHARRIVAKFSRSLREGGWLIVSPSELSSELFDQFVATPFEGAILYRKKGETQLRPGVAFGTAAPAMQFHENPAEAAQSTVDFTPAHLQSLSTPAAFEPVAEQVSRSICAEERGEQPTPYLKALSLFEQGDYAAAAQLLEADILTVPGSAERLALMARICANLGELTAARAWAEQALLLDKLDAGLHYLRAVILREAGSHQEAIAALQRSLYLAPDFILAHFALGGLARQQGRTKEADKHFTNALALLKRCPAGEALPHSDGLAAERLGEMIQSSLSMSGAA